ncbi:MAG: 16S rRNA (adenine(1518)-N(6)/adenine(1519)-N(6))-dimethyltransferase RsmA [Alphaproteobacteria bacterium]|nr:MAG: 16S rRNA (adenine(1518)-N(6)/adenine(1519)-N(6))-dimethyltransferase RsmA [Alphaproteobacteria bacterium]
MDKSIEHLPPLRETIGQFGLRAEKSLGQNFLLDLNITRKIARYAAPLDNGTIVEIGPGPGGLTRALFLEGAKHVVAIEKDYRCIEALQQIAAHTDAKLDIRNEDALEVKIADIGPAPIKIIANLPYNIATPLLLEWLHEIYAVPGKISDMILMFQREVADRIIAVPRTKDYGRLSVISQWLCHVKPLFTLPPQAFTPAPKVESTVVQITPRAAPLFPGQIKDLERLTAAMFGQRRKMLRVSLKQIWPDAEAKLIAAGLNPTARAEELNIEDFGKLVSLL